MTRRASVVLCGVGTFLIGAAYGSAFLPNGPAWGVWCMVLGLTSLVTGCMALGTVRRGKKHGLILSALVLTALSLLLGFGLAITLPSSEGATSLLVLGFPVRAAAVLYIVGALPLFALPLTYTITFREHTLSDDDLARVREARQGSGVR